MKDRQTIIVGLQMISTWAGYFKDGEGIPREFCGDAEKYAMDAIGYLTPKPRVLDRDEVLNGHGGGYIEQWFSGENEDDPEDKCIDECGYARGQVIVWDGSTVTPARLKKWYNKPYGMRIWTGKPSPDEQEGAKWDD